MLTKYKEPCCFAAGTKVSTPNGDRAIESLKVGDVVWSKPERGGKPFAAKILATHQRSDQPIYRLKLKSVRVDGKAEGETLLVTPGHPFYVPAKRDFIPVIDLKPGDLLQSLADGETDNTSSEVESLELYLPVGETFNLTVDVGHTFYVGDLKTWVHNTGPCALPPDFFSKKGGVSTADKVAEGEVGTYGSTAPRSVGDGLTPDHIPSFAAVKESLRQMGVELTDVELKALRNNTNCVIVKTCSHMTESRTFGGRNNSEKVRLDGSNLYKAAEADIDTWVPVWKSEGWSASKIKNTRKELHEANEKLFQEIGIKYESK